MFFLTLFTLTSAAIIPRDACTAGSVTLYDRECTIECGIDHAGGDYASMQASFDECQQECAKNPSCLTAQYFNGYCYLKDCINSASANPNVDSIVCGSGDPATTTPPASNPTPAPSCTSGPTTINGRSGQQECSIDRPGGDFASLQVATLLDCETACADSPQCITAQYSNGFCYLKDSAKPPVPNAAVSGILFDTTTTTTTTSSTTSSTTTTSTTESTTASSTTESTTTTTTTESTTASTTSSPTTTSPSTTTTSTPSTTPSTTTTTASTTPSTTTTKTTTSSTTSSSLPSPTSCSASNISACQAKNDLCGVLKSDFSQFCLQNGYCSDCQKDSDCPTGNAPSGMPYQCVFNNYPGPCGTRYNGACVYKRAPK